MSQSVARSRYLELDRFLAAYEAAQQREGKADLTEFLPPADHSLYRTVLCELIRLDLEYGWERGQPRDLVEYQLLFPELNQDRESLQAIAFEEYRLRRQAGENPSLHEYRQRFGISTTGWPAGGLQIAECRMQNDEEVQEASEDLEPNAEVPESIGNLQSAFSKLPAEFLGFHLVEELGRGAFARVFLAQQIDLRSRFVVLKIAANIAGETERLVQLQHTNIVPVYSVHRDGAWQALCMPWFGATTLADVLRDVQERPSLPDSGQRLVDTLTARQESTLEFVDRASCIVHRETSQPENAANPSSRPTTHAPRSTTHERFTTLREALARMTYEQAVLWIGVRLADGLGHAHERGILHRDLKPANILLTDEGQPMLLDFNLSEDTKEPSRTSRAYVGGTLPYMAPEHLEALGGGSRPVDARSDLYSLGTILYGLLTGRHPFPVRRGPLPEVLTALHTDRLGPVPRVRCWNKAVSPAVESIIRHCLEPDPDRRYQSAGQLREDLQRQLDNLPLKHAPEPSWIERTQKWVRRHPRLTSWSSVGTVAGLVIVVLLTLLVTWWHRLAHLEAQTARRQLGKDLGTALLLLNGPTGGRKHYEEGLALCERAAKRYHLLDTPAWQDKLLVRKLSAEEQRQLREQLSEMLFLWARALAGEAAANPDPARSREQVQFALDLNARSAECYAPDEAPRALGLQRALLTRLSGDEAEARRLHEQAEQVPLRTFRDRYLVLLQQMGPGQGGAVAGGRSSNLVANAAGSPPGQGLPGRQSMREVLREALAFLHEASPHDRSDFAVWLVLGNGHAALGERDRAAGYYEIASALWPDSPRAWLSRGLLFLDNKQPERAAADFVRAIELRPDLMEAWFNRALARLQMNRPADALEDFSHIIQTVENPPTRVFFARARVRAQLGDREGQRQDLQEGFRREPTDDNDCLARGVARHATDPKAALADFEKALTFNPLSRGALQNQASVLADQLGRPADAIKVLDRLLTLYPDAELALAGRGVLHARLGAREAALRDAAAVLARDRRPELLYQVAGIYAQTSRQQPDDAREALRWLAASLQQRYGLDLIANDKDLDPLRELPDFRRLLDRVRSRKD
jgi:serine/threonine protein kinase/lipoprotein NlpI